MTGGDVAAVGVKSFNAGKDLVNDAKDGNIFAVGKDLVDIGGIASDVGKFASGAQGNILGDPLNELISAGLGFLIDLIAPLKEALNLVTGDPDGLNGKAEEWAAVAEDLRKLGPEVVQDAQSTAASWTGTAGDAFRQKMANFSRGVSSVAGQADHVADVLRISATLMDAAQSIIKSIIASWVEYAIITEAAAAASAAFTFGASEAAGQAAVAGEAAVACERGASTVGETSGILSRIANALKQLEGTFGQLGKAVEQEAAVMRQAEGALRGAAENFARQSAQQAEKALNEGIKDAFKDGVKDIGIGLADDAVHSNSGQDGHESQQQIDDDLSFNK